MGVSRNNTTSRQSDSWLIAQAVFAANAEMANKKALKALSKGAESIVFTIPSEDTEIETLLKNINLKTTILYFDFQFLSPTYIKKLNSLNEEGNAGFFLIVLVNFVKQEIGFLILKKIFNLLMRF